MREVLVWDLPTRLFHWLLFGSVVLAYFTAEGEGLVHQVHVAAGYGVGVLLLFRLIWGVLGGRHARFDDFARNLRQLPGYLPGLLRLSPRRFVGHNPLGVVMIAAMVATLVGVLWTGLYGGEELHETLGNLIVILAVIHVLGVVADSLLTGENLVSAMITGRKRLADRDAADETGTAPASWRSLAAAALTAVVTLGAFQQSETLKWPPSTEGEIEAEEQHDEGGDEHHYEDDD